MEAPRRDSKWWGWGAPQKLPELDTAARGVLNERIGELEPWPLAHELDSFELPDGVGINIGFSPGDAASDEQYAYVGPWDRAGLDGPFWNAAFGSLRAATELLDADSVAAYFSAGRAAA